MLSRECRSSVMMTADNIAYALQRDLNLFVLLQHIVHLFQRRKRCEGSAYKFFFICLLSVDLRELIDDPSAVQNLAKLDMLQRNVKFPLPH